jgi:plastocyanin
MKKILLLLIFPSLIFAQSSHIINAGMMYYSPSVLTINVGDTVHWINDGGFHNVNFDISSISGLSFNNPESFISDPTSDTEMYTHVFNIPGNYEYDCSVYGHASSGMTGTIIVNSVNQIFEHVSNKKLLEVFSLIGNNVKSTKNKILIYRYNDGTVLKKVVLE